MIKILCFLFALNCGDQQETYLEYFQRWANPQTGIITEDEKWRCPEGYSMMVRSTADAGYFPQPYCLPYILATRK